MNDLKEICDLLAGYKNTPAFMVTEAKCNCDGNKKVWYLTVERPAAEKQEEANEGN